jgi:hypothetical protein
LKELFVARASQDQDLSDDDLSRKKKIKSESDEEMAEAQDDDLF